MKLIYRNRFLIVVVLLSNLINCVSEFNCENEDDHEMCVELFTNSTVTFIGYCVAETTLSVNFVNMLSHCKGELPYLTNRLVISLNNFKGTYQNRKTEYPELFNLEKDTETLFKGQIECNDECVIPIPIRLPNVEISYIREMHELTENIIIEIDTNGQMAGEYKIWNAE